MNNLYIAGKSVFQYMTDNKDTYRSPSVEPAHGQYDNYGIYDLVCIDTKSSFFSTFNNRTTIEPELFQNDFTAIQAYAPTRIPFNFVNEFVLRYQ